jgi:hypothetical protein
MHINTLCQPTRLGALQIGQFAIDQLLRGTPMGQITCLAPRKSPGKSQSLKIHSDRQEKPIILWKKL